MQIWLIESQKILIAVSLHTWDFSKVSLEHEKPHMLSLEVFRNSLLWFWRNEYQLTVELTLVTKPGPHGMAAQREK